MKENKKKKRKNLTLLTSEQNAEISIHANVNAKGTLFE